MNNIKFKRIMAYLMDILIISMLVLLISKIKVLNPNYKEYQKAYKDYTEYTESISNSTNNIEQILNKDYLDIVYKISYYSISYTIIEFFVILLYFTLFPKFNNNQTIGKKLFKISLTTYDEKKKLSVWNHLLRSLLLPIWTNVLLYTNIFNLFNIVVLLLFKSSIYLKLISVLSIIICIYCYVDVIVMLASKDSRALHDIITKTKVVEHVKTK